MTSHPNSDCHMSLDAFCVCSVYFEICIFGLLSPFSDWLPILIKTLKQKQSRFVSAPVVSHRCTAELVALSTAVVCGNKCFGSHKRIAVCEIGYWYHRWQTTMCVRAGYTSLHCRTTGFGVFGLGARGGQPSVSSYHKILTLEDINKSLRRYINTFTAIVDLSRSHFSIARTPLFQLKSAM